MLLNLVRKDFLLVKKYLPLMFAIAVAVPLYLNVRAAGTFMEGSFFNFFLSTLYVQYLVFNSVSLAEYKSKGNALLCALPYSRSAFITAKYLFLFLIFLACLLLYYVGAWFMPQQTAVLAPPQIAFSFSLLTLVFCLLVPLQIHFGYEKMKFIFAILIVATPFVLPQLLKAAEQNNAGGASAGTGWEPSIIMLLLAALIAIVVSRRLSIQLYSQKIL